MSAANELKITLGFIQKFYDQSIDTPEGEHKANDYLRLATQHLEAARKLDPTATIMRKYKDGEDENTQDELAGELLRAEGLMAPGTERAVEAYKKAIQYRPTDIRAHVLLAKTYASRNQRQDALDIIEKARAIDPTNIDVIEIADKMSANTNIGTEVKSKTNPDIFVAVAWVGAIAGVVAAIFVNSGLGGFIIVLSIILGIYGKIAGKKYLINKAIEAQRGYDPNKL